MLDIDISRYRDMAFIEARVTRILRVAELGECWEWNRARTNRKYGHFTITAIDGRAFQYKAHRAAFEIFTGVQLLDGHALHKCDNPPCCNPEHLFEGTHELNMADMRTKGRAVGHLGARNPNVRLKSEQVSEIRSSTARASDLAARYGVSKGHVYVIRRGTSWPVQRAA